MIKLKDLLEDKHLNTGLSDTEKTEVERDFNQHHASSMYSKHMGTPAEKHTVDSDDGERNEPGVQEPYDKKKDNIDRGYEPVDGDIEDDKLNVKESMLLRDLMAEEKKLRIFDFDDTLVKTKSFIFVTHRDGKKSKLSPGEYAVYNPKQGDQFDFSDFNNVNQPEQIMGYTKLLKRFVSSEGERRVTILTARSAYAPVKQYLKDIGMGSIYVMALGDSDPQKKAKYIEDMIKKGYDDIFFIDDSAKNVAAVQQLEKKYPEVKFRIQLAKL